MRIRPRQDEDGEFLAALALARFTRLGIGDLAELQDRAQRAAYSARPGSVGEHVVLADLGDGEAPVGRVWWADGADERHVLDLAVLQTAEGRGIGAAVVEMLVASAGGRRVRVEVEHRLPHWRARLERAGFVAVADDQLRATLIAPGRA